MQHDQIVRQITEQQVLYLMKQIRLSNYEHIGTSSNEQNDLFYIELIVQYKSVH